MRYSEVTNDLFMRRRMTPANVWFEGTFTDEELDSLEDHLNNEELKDAEIISSEYDNSVRISKISFIAKDYKTEWLFNRFNSVIDRANHGYFGFDLYGYDAIQYTTYDKDGKFEWHTDFLYGNQLGNTINNDTRKLTVVMLLNSPDIDFTGGEFMINTGNQDDATQIELKRGTIIAFPSFLSHKVMPVLSGIRKSLVIWVEGPKFR